MPSVSAGQEPGGKYDHKGWMYKQGSFMKTWKRRFFTLEGPMLTYYDTSSITSTTKAKGRIRVESVEEWNELRNGMLFTGNDGQRVLKVYTDTNGNRMQWLEAIRAVLKSNKSKQEAAENVNILDRSVSVCINNPASLQTSLSRPSTATAMEEMNAEPAAELITRGWLYRKSALGAWKMNYFELKGRNLAMFDSPQALGKYARLSGVVESFCDIIDEENALQLVVISGTNGASRILYVVAPSYDEKDMWSRSLAAALGVKLNGAGADEELADEGSSSYLMPTQSISKQMTLRNILEKGVFDEPGGDSDGNSSKSEGSDGGGSFHLNDSITLERGGTSGTKTDSFSDASFGSGVSSGSGGSGGNRGSDNGHWAYSGGDNGVKVSSGATHDPPRRRRTENSLRHCIRAVVANLERDNSELSAVSEGLENIELDRKTSASSMRSVDSYGGFSERSLMSVSSAKSLVDNLASPEPANLQASSSSKSLSTSKVVNSNQNSSRADAYGNDPAMSSAQDPMDSFRESSMSVRESTICL